MSPSSAVPLIGFYASVRKQSLESFTKRHPEPVLLYLATVATDSDTHFVTTEAAAIVEMRRTEGTEAGKRGRQERVAPLRKSPRNPIARQICIGRGVDNDVVIEEPTVSKMHAYLEQVGGAWHLCDIDSANGTFLAGNRLPPNEPTPLADGTEIALGSCLMRFVLAESFYAYVKSALALTGPA